MLSDDVLSNFRADITAVFAEPHDGFYLRLRSGPARASARVVEHRPVLSPDDTIARVLAWSRETTGERAWAELVPTGGRSAVASIALPRAVAAADDDHTPSVAAVAMTTGDPTAAALLHIVDRWSTATDHAARLAADRDARQAATIDALISQLVLLDRRVSEVEAYALTPIEPTTNTNTGREIAEQTLAAFFGNQATLAADPSSMIRAAAPGIRAWLGSLPDAERDATLAALLAELLPSPASPASSASHDTQDEE